MHRAPPGLTHPEGEHFPNPSWLLLSLCLHPTSRRRQPTATLVLPVSLPSQPTQPSLWQDRAAALLRGQRRDSGGSKAYQCLHEWALLQQFNLPKGAAAGEADVFPPCCDFPKPCSLGTCSKDLPGILLTSLSAEKGGRRSECQQTPAPISRNH